MCSRGFKLHRVYSISFNSSNVGEFVWRWILKDCIKVQEKRKRVVVLCSRPLKTRDIWQFHVVVAQRRQGNAQKRVMDVQVCCFANLNLLFLFLPLSLPSPSRRISIESQGQLEDKANDVTFTMQTMRCHLYWTSVFRHNSQCPRNDFT